MKRWIETRLVRLTEWIWKLIPETRLCIFEWRGKIQSLLLNGVVSYDEFTGNVAATNISSDFKNTTPDWLPQSNKNHLTNKLHKSDQVYV